MRSKCERVIITRASNVAIGCPKNEDAGTKRESTGTCCGAKIQTFVLREDKRDHWVLEDYHSDGDYVTRKIIQKRYQRLKEKKMP